jgi:polar amino acid transport system substrate-binding protein
MKKTLSSTALAICAATLLIAACRPAPATPAPTPTSALQAPVTGPEPINDDLSKILASGVITVGVSADYPPFAFYGSDFKIDGFEPALINHLAGTLGVKADLNDFAFEGLLAALQLGQVDAVIAAVSVTPEREAQVDFTNPYYIGADGVLGQADAETITGTLALAGKRVGAQRGSVYDTYLKRNLVDRNLSRPSDIFLYTNVDDAVRDLKTKRLDYVMIDRTPARKIAQTEGLKVVGEGFNPQTFAIAVRKGSNLRDALNDALLRAQSDGTVSALIQKYLNVNPDEIEPVPTVAPVPTTQAPAATNTPAPAATTAPAPCVNGAAFVADLNLDDQNMTAPPVMQPGQRFTKGWRFRNSGNCNWAASFFLGFVFGNVPGAQMGGQPTQVGAVIAPGQTVDINVNLIAPNQPGTYQGFWQMNDTNGVPFGERVWVGITVPGPATPTPAPTNTPVPGITFTADRFSVNQGECVTFRWSVEGVSGVWLHPSDRPFQNYGVPGVGSQVQCPQQTTTYVLRVQFNDGTVQTQSATITVTPAQANDISIGAFTSQLEGNGCVLLMWSINGNVSRVSLLRGNQVIWDGAPITGNYSDCAPGAGLVNYTLQAFAPDNSVTRATQTINVGGPGLPTPIP